MNRSRKITLSLFMVAVLLIAAGCTTRTQELLAEDYLKMGNEDLLRYFYRLDDEIQRQEMSQGPEFGFGIGTFGHHSGVGLGVGTGSGGYTADELRKRRIDVRMELKKRGLNP
ncbi:hypothetical protein SAMN04489760_11253 [Syntrophus gentianae]|uniref:Lipoprotein n=1 Tax=Syntrophus gentianae TaxID=43775 RepID=A0A1H7XXA2_9BACT|nr:hypothetical protein [Syntrophus gentianae]SEM37599.1 hypothetical protein SAMN04489760_11253 [Syntrophus gentianae]